MEKFVTKQVAQIICNGFNPDLKIVSWKSEPGSKLGDGTTSKLIATTITAADTKNPEQQQILEVMLKTVPNNPTMREMMNETNGLEKEPNIYRDVLPVLEEAQKEAGIPQKERISPWPKYFAANFTEKGDSDFLALENLKKDGFKHGNRVTGLDFNHCALAIRTMAKFHAISIAKFGGSRENILTAFPFLRQNLFDKKTKISKVQQQYFSQSFQTQAESLKNAGEEVASSRLEKLAKADICDVLGGLLVDNIEWAVITHGDLWVNNMMFKYDETSGNKNLPVSVKFFDFQLTQATSRLVDVFYFLLNSAQKDVLQNREDDLLQIYYAEFTTFAERLGVNTTEKGLTWENFLKEAETFRLYSIFFAVIVAPITSARAEDVTDIETFSEDDLDNTSGALGEMIKRMTRDLALQKTKTLVLEHLPKCKNAKGYL